MTGNDAPESTDAVPPGGLGPALSVEEPLRCPLCGYDLRGLPEPRCPECGYVTTWEALLDPRLRVHPYLFEHHPERSFDAFWQTLGGGLRPRRFWEGMFPTQPSRPKRLVAYWVLAATPLMVALVATHALMIVHHARRMTVERGRVGTYPPKSLEHIKAIYGSIELYMDDTFPLPPQLRFFQALYGDGPGPATWVALMWLAWPWLTFLVLLVFRISMRRARIRPVHLLRCVLYSFDAVLWIGLLFAAGMEERGFLTTTPFAPPLVRWPGILEFILPPVEGPGAAALFFGGAAVVLFMAWRLVVAVRQYLKFDHAVATVLATQAIVLLVMLVVAMMPG